MFETQVHTEELIKRQSITPDDAGCQQYMQNFLTELGFKCHDLSQADVKNFYAVYGDQNPTLCFAGHTDVVPIGNLSDWSYPPFSATIKDDLIYGRGTADMKGSLAAMLVAAKHFVSNNSKIKGSLAFLITSDEEGPAIHGTKVALEKLQQQNKLPNYCVVGEPSSDKLLADTIKIGRRGSLSGFLSIKGKQGHVAYPEKVTNPIHQAAAALNKIATTKWDNGNEHFPPTSLQIVDIRSGTGALNVVPPEVDVKFNLRFCPSTQDSDIKNQVHKILDDLGIKYQLEWRLSAEPFYTQADSKLVQATCQAINNHTALSPTITTTGGTSDGRFFAKYNIEVVELGPINETIHQVNECVSLKDLDHLAAIYQDIMQQILL